MRPRSELHHFAQPDRSRRQGLLPHQPPLSCVQPAPRDTDADTVGGYITELAQRIPLKGDSVSDTDFTFTEATPSSISKVKITTNSTTPSV
ncbi:MAG: hypothetical protein J6386_18970 [Candidatus Synoicihabitans palmerolidicus]|nr:hypothetical protein [Candidatus Synoicihabitans palmerolidicus]